MLEEFPSYCLNESQMEQLIPIEDMNNNYSCHGWASVGWPVSISYIQTSPDDGGQHLLNMTPTEVHI